MTTKSRAIALLFTGVTAGLAFGATACKKPQKAPARDVYAYSLYLPKETIPPSVERDARVILNGKELGKVDKAFDVPAATWMSDPSVTLALRVATTCGSSDLPLKVELSKTGEESERESSGPIRLDVKVGTAPKVALVYFDNLTGKQASTVAIGKLVPEVKAGEKKKVDVVVGDCPEARKVRADGKDVGELATRDIEGTLVDVVGGLCYETDVAEYRQYAQDPLLRSDNRKELSGARAYPVLKIDYFFEEPPTEKPVQGGFDMNTVVKHVKCKK